MLAVTLGADDAPTGPVYEFIKFRGNVRLITSLSWLAVSAPFRACCWLHARLRPCLCLAFAAACVGRCSVHDTHSTDARQRCSHMPLSLPQALTSQS